MSTTRRRRRTSTARPKRTSAPASRRPAPRPGGNRRRGPDPVTRLARATFHAAACGAGTLARAPRTPDIPAGDRQDGGGLAAVITAGLLAALTWWPATSPALLTLHRPPQDAGGALAGALPVIALLVAWRLFRHPHHPQRTGQVLSGAAIAYLGALALAAVVSGLPTPLHGGGLAALRPAGGLPGWLVTVPFSRFGGVYLAGPAAALLLLGGIRLIAGVPFSQIRYAVGALVQGDDLTAGSGADGDDASDRDAAAPAGDHPATTAALPPALPDPPADLDVVDSEPYATPHVAGTTLPSPDPAPAPPAPAPDAAPAPDPGPQTAALPPLSLLRTGAAHHSRTKASDAMMATLQQTLDRFKVDAKVTGYTRGPAVTRYEVTPGPAVQVAKITRYERDFQLAAGREDVRVLPVIPGKQALGIEVPNPDREVVTLGDVLSSPVATGNPSPLLIGLGKDIEGRTLVADLAKLLHTLFAGETGGGKSVCENALIISLLMRLPPELLRFLMIDPKQVELSAYRGLPHLWKPIVTDPEDAPGALESVTDEMDHRYSQMADYGVKHIDQYNANVAAGKIRAADGTPLEPMPYLVVLIDELADLMLTAPKEVQRAIIRIAQLGRAAGILLVIATQRPSVDVVTGLIKANIPSRIALSTSSLTDSRVILDQPGAELLTGQGDALYLPRGTSQPVRLQWAFVTDAEIDAVVKYWTSLYARKPAPATI